MKITAVIALLLTPLAFLSPVRAQTTTPMPESVERQLPRACSVDVINLIDAICNDKGTINTAAINLPGVCQQYGFTKEIESKLRECQGQNVFFEMWKFKFNIENDFKNKFVEYVSSIRRNEAASNAVSSMTSSSEAFRLSVWACGLDAECHRSLFKVLPDEVKTELSKTPYFCDYTPQITDFDDAPYRHMFFKEEYPDGVAQPMCRSYYCKYKQCSSDVAKAELFILSDVFRKQYDLLYKVIQP